MLRNALLSTVAAAAFASSAHAAALFSDTFTYPDGNLVGQGGWTQVGTTATNPIQVTSGSAVVGATGQDAYSAFSSTTTTIGDLASLDTKFVATVSTTSATGDYFLHLGDNGATSAFYERVFVKSGTTGNFVLGIGGFAAPATTGFGADISLSAPHTYDVVWNINPGLANDTFTVTVDGAAYLTNVAFSGTEPASTAIVSSANLRQGTAGNTVTASVDSVSVTSVAATPEPASLALLGLVGVATLRRRR